MIFDSERLQQWQPGDAAAHRHKLLVVDDEPSNLRVMSSALSRGFDVLEASDADAALEVIARNPDICLVISDQRMPGRSGVELLEECQRLIPDAIGVIVTGYVDIESVIQAINDAGIYKFILKPVDMHELMRTVRLCIDQYEQRKERARELDELRSQMDRCSREFEQERQAWLSEALVDPATGLPNRRFMTRQLDREQALLERQFSRQGGGAREFGVGIMQFLLVRMTSRSALMDEFGEPAGEAIMVRVAAALAEVIRPWDLLARWSESAFLVVARDSSGDECRELAASIHRSIDGLQLVFYGKAVSAPAHAQGYACFPVCAAEPGALDWPDVVSLASRCLESAERCSESAWVGLSPTPSVTSLDMGDGLPAPEALISQGLLALDASIDPRHVRWSD